MTAISIDDRTEWLETDGRGGFASGTTSGIRTRRYHALLLPAMTPPTGRIVLVNGFDAFVETAGGRFALSTQRYQPDVLHPDGAGRIESFIPEPWPTWEFRLPDGTRLRQELFLERPSGACWLAWTLLAGEVATLHVHPFLSGRDYHVLHRENGSFRFDEERCGAAQTFGPTTVCRRSRSPRTGTIVTTRSYRNFLYAIERERGLDDTEDLASPGVFSWELGRRTARS